MDVRDLGSSIFWLAIALFVFVQGLRLDIGTLHVPGPGFVLVLGGGVLGVFALLLLVATVAASRRGQVETQASSRTGFGQRKVILAVCALFAYLALLPRIGFFITTFALMTFMYRLLGRNILLQAAAGLVTVALVYLIFTVWLQIPTPKGIVGF